MKSVINKKEYLLATGILFSLTVILFHKVFLHPDKIILALDVRYLHYFYKHFLLEEISKGNFPLWLPYTFIGIPLLPTMQISCFYPSMLLYLLFPLNLAFGFDFALHIFLAGLFMFLLARSLTQDFLSAMLAASAYMFSGFYLRQIYGGHLTIII